MKESDLTGKVYDIQGFSVQDGPGIRTTVFLKGCPLRCPWCHSPESQSFAAQLSWMAMRCIGVEKCGKCLTACTKGAITSGEITKSIGIGEAIKLIHVNRLLCDDCGDCARACHPGGLSMCGADYQVDDLLKQLCRDIPFYEQSGGGVTVSGGEALSQPEFTLKLLQGLKAQGVHTALDTTGFSDYKNIDAVLPYVDLFLYDLKHMDSEQHKKAIGVPNERILENAQKIAAAGGKLQIRIPVIPSFNDSEKNIKSTGKFCKSLGKAVTLVQILPYHNMGVAKYLRICDDPKVLEAEPPSEEKIQNLKKILECFALKVTVH
ncbi:glycyl-radical enzyme activating protein [Acetobacterium paludosum]|uniref:Glycyl-radical enzyme activating protein n=1 Tax=Acetobacterium paludosum TaxID=52693 RepID=A0A923HYN4_9FIRM|nr:glycyl-radical enzyme activating protein [Acetobacterium paludosum]MBC3889572.1 glycyl-radical enzyme activating protein [Acetobacterium paludosum]